MSFLKNAIKESGNEFGSVVEEGVAAADVGGAAGREAMVEGKAEREVAGEVVRAMTEYMAEHMDDRHSIEILGTVCDILVNTPS